MVLATSQQEFSDADFRVVDNGDQSKKLAFEVSGLTTATTRTLTVQDASGTVYVSGGTDVPVTDGGTGASTAAGALTNLGVSSFIQTLLDDASATAALATLGIVVGRYTPTLTNTTNVASSTASAATKYAQVGDTVIVAGQVAIDPTAAAPTATVLDISLPVASNLSASTQVSGVANEPNASGQTATITGNATNDTATLTYSASDAAQKTWQFIFMYQVI